MKKIDRYISILSWLAALAIVSCSPLKKANKSFEAGEFSTAIHQYKKAVKPNDPTSNYALAEAYRQSNQLKKAEPYYKVAIDNNIAEEKAYYYYAQALKSNGKETEAKKILTQYLDKGEDKDVVIWAQNELDNLNRMEEVRSMVNYFRVKSLDEINTPYAEYSPVYNNGYLYFTSNRDGGKTYKGTGTPFTDIYRARTKGAKVDIETLQALDENINTSDINEGSITLSENGRTMIFAKANSGKSSGTNEVNLYFTRYRNGKWSEARPLSINKRDAWDSCPALTADGTTLYFASNREGGYGGIDIYTAKLNRRGRWVDVRNMGAHINTPGNELFPYVGGTGVLYFASDGQPGYGGLDLFEATRGGGKEIIKNLGEPINSSSDDFGLYLFNPSRGFFTSNRKGGKGDDDIYTFVNDDPNLKIVNYYLSGSTLTPDENKKLQPLPNTKVLLVDEEDGIIDEQFTEVDGRYRFRVYSEENYYLIAEKENYFTTRIDFSTIGKSIDKSTLTEMVTNVEFKQDLPLNQIVIEKPIVLNNIYYDLNKANIKPAAAKELDKLVVIMKDNPEITIELSSHTDVRADHDYNMDLSQRRAESAVNYIISQGIEKDRIVAKGYGETKLIVEDAENEIEHQQNRRTEFKVIKYNARHVDEEEGDEEGDDEDTDDTDRFFSDLDEDTEN
ncbi:WD40-like Beta Propeller Repeat [Reichenbachiella agariperforans]|uniref:WD40-like Beta Propeller Repeat n=1 Tax=Reichenbachiella agariperforans TaxID=156994 RepID=A0A1M6NE37_REIAG|nr:OmpA family protein [Reichenbachiella agariperforans]SHJ93987.1 WD40-like Beta Propeller Repeat [Reichenbachiella agariperforans]